MIFKYLSWASVLVMSILLFSSCLNSSDDNVEYSPDAQIYAFSMASNADTLNLLSSTAFTIDQVNGRIFNKEPLPYLFHVDSVTLSLSSSSTYLSFSRVEIHLQQPDSSYYWAQGDSVPVNRLQQIITTAPDGKTTKTYTVQLDIYEEDPYILSWDRISQNYLTPPVEAQKTIVLNSRFITYYTSGTAIKAMTTPADDGVNWSAADLTGLPPTILLSSLTASEDAVYALDALTEALYKTTDGIDWNPVTLPYSVKAIYGSLPSATGGDILAVVNHNGTLTFAETNDFTDIILLNKVPDNIPVKDFSATKVDNPTSYSTRYLILSGGATTDNSLNNAIWILQEKEGTITYISRAPEVLLLGSRLFFYDNRLYLMVSSSGKNSLLYSENFGLDWIAAGENQAFPADFTYRTDASVITDADNYIWIFGGVSSTPNQLVEVWKGRLNKFSGE
jgi:hypothetical protein